MNTTGPSILQKVLSGVHRCCGWWKLHSRHGSLHPTPSSEPRRPRIEVELSACSQVLEVTSRQVRATAQDIELSVVQVSSGISSMAEKARAIIAEAESARSNQATLDRALSSARKTLRQVEFIADEARLVGINGQLEAARAGESGSAFNVVASETSRLASSATSTSMSLQQLLEELRAVHNGLLQSLELSQKRSAELNREFTGAVMTLQFQDRVNQQLGNVAKMLDSLKESLLHYTAGADAGETQRRAAEWMELLCARSTMQSERDLTQQTDSSSDGSATVSTGSVELF